MLKFRSSVLSFLLSCIVFSSACVKKASDGGSSATEIVVGEYGSMTGSESSFGVSTHRGIIMAIDEVNQSGGVKGKKIRLVSLDDQGKSDEAVTAVTKLITQDKVVSLLGEVASSRSIAAGAVAQRYKVPMVSPSSTNPKVTEIGDYIFRVCFIDPFQGSVMAKFAANYLKVKRAAVLRDIRSDYSVGLANYFVDEFKKLGGEVVADVAYASQDTDFNAQLNVVKSKKPLPDALFVPGYYTEVGLIARQARQQGLKAVILGGDGWDSDKLTEIGGNAIFGGFYSTHFAPEDKNPMVQNFVTQYKKKFNEVPNSLAAQGYDAAMVTVDAMKRAPDLTPQALRDALATTKNFQGVTGIITLDEKRNAVKPAVVLKVNGHNQFQYVTTVNP